MRPNQSLLRTPVASAVDGLGRSVGVAELVVGPNRQMKSAIPTRAQFWRSTGVFALFLIVALLLPYASLMLRTDVGFLVPQYLFPYDALQSVKDQSSDLVFSKGVGAALNAGHWILVGTLFGAITRRARLRTVTWQAVASIAGTCVLMMVVFKCLNLRIAVDAL